MPLIMRDIENIDMTLISFDSGLFQLDNLK